MNFIYKILILTLVLIPSFSFASFPSASVYSQYGCSSGNQRLVTSGDVLSGYLTTNTNACRLRYFFEQPIVSGDVIKYDVNITTNTGSLCSLYLYGNSDGYSITSYLNSSVNLFGVGVTSVTATSSSNVSYWGWEIRAQLSSATVCTYTIENISVNGEPVDQFFTVSEPTITYVPIQSEVTALECVTNTPTSTCSFSYSTTTASTTSDYTRHFDLFLLFVGLSFFALAIHLFRGLALKYL